jgi:hypothetical protein
MNKRAISSVVAVLALTLSACGGSDDDSKAADDKAKATTPSASASADAKTSEGEKKITATGDYCKDLASAQGAITGDANSASLERSLEAFKILTASAPKKIAGDWKQVQGAFQEVSDAFAKAGVEMSDSDALQKAITDGDVDVKVLESLTNDKTLKAMTNIEAHAKSDCKVDLAGTADAK